MDFFLFVKGEWRQRRPMAGSSPLSLGVCVQCTENACAGNPGAGWAMSYRP